MLSIITYIRYNLLMCLVLVRSENSSFYILNTPNPVSNFQLENLIKH